MIRTIKKYFWGMSAYDICHKPTLLDQWHAFTSEVTEFRSSPSWDETWDVLHAFGRIFYKMTRLPLQLLVWPAVRKHAFRYDNTKCVRSRRNCCNKCCCQNYL